MCAASLKSRTETLATTGSTALLLLMLLLVASSSCVAAGSATVAAARARPVDVLVVSLRARPVRWARLVANVRASWLSSVAAAAATGLSSAPLSSAPLPTLPPLIAPRLVRVVALDTRDAPTALSAAPLAPGQARRLRLGLPRRRHQDLTPGAVGCYVSHVRCWQAVARSGADGALVLEDDASLPPLFWAQLARALERGWAACPRGRSRAVVLLHAWCDPAMWDRLSCPEVGRGVFRADRFWSTACYWVSSGAAREMLARALPVAMQVDHAIASWGRAGAVDVVHVPLAGTSSRGGGSDVQTLPLLPPGGARA